MDGLQLFLAVSTLSLIGLLGVYRARKKEVGKALDDSAPETPGPDGALCRYCSERATHPVPRIEHVRSPLDRLWRSLGMVPVVRWTVNTVPNFDHYLCELHGYRARTLLEKEVADAMVARAEWTDRQTKHLIEYQARGLNEKLVEDCAPQKKLRGTKPVASVTALVTVRRSNGDA